MPLETEGGLLSSPDPPFSGRIGNMRYKAIGFDMDGTLIDSDIDYCRLTNVEFDTLRDLGIPDDVLKGLNEIEMIDSGRRYLESIGKKMSTKELCDLVNRNAGIIETECLVKARIFPGVKEMLEKFRSEGYRLGLLTRGQRFYAESAMNKFDIMHYMDAVEAYDDHPFGEQKPNPIAMEYLARALGVKTNEILYIGDSVLDYFCARDAGTDFIAIGPGSDGKRRWDPYKDKIPIVDCVTDMMQFL